MGERQPDVQGREPGLGAGADQRRDESQDCEARGRRGGADRREGVMPVRAGEKREGDEQRERAETGHHQVDIARARILVLAVVRHHQRPGGERHELPRQQEGIGVGGDQDEVHARKEGGEERQHALRIVFVTAIAERIEARCGGGEVHDDEKERRERIDMETRADPGEAQRQNDRLALAAERERADRDDKQKRGHGERPAVDDGPPQGSSGAEPACDRKSEERGVAEETERLGAHLLPPLRRKIEVLLTAPTKTYANRSLFSRKQ